MNKASINTPIKLTEDRYGGVIIDESTVPQTMDEFEENLIKIIPEQTDKKKLCGLPCLLVSQAIYRF